MRRIQRVFLAEGAFSKSGVLKKPLLALLLFALTAASGVSAQEPILLSYERNFIRAGLLAKVEVLQDAATDERAQEFIGELYELALNFSLQNADMFKEDPDMIALIVSAVRGVRDSFHTVSTDTLWEVFSIYRNSLTRGEILGALAVLGRENRQVVNRLNQYLTEQNNFFRSRMSIDFSVLSACIAALGVLGDPSSYPVLFSAMINGYPDTVSGEAALALGSIRGDYKQYLIEVIRKNPPAEKLIAFDAGMNNEKFGGTERGEIAEAALDTGLAASSGEAEDRADLASLRYAAVQALTGLKWTRAASLAIKNFHQVQDDYVEGNVPKKQLLEAIACLGVMGNSEASQTLILQLGYINSQTERSGTYDGDITLELLKALGNIGDKSAFDYLLYVGYLPYSEEIQDAAREALNRLKW
jgi:hypothetical protein